MSTALNTAGNFVSEFGAKEEAADINLAIDLLSRDIPRKKKDVRISTLQALALMIISCLILWFVPRGDQPT